MRSSTEDGHAGIDIRGTSNCTEIIIRATRIHDVLDEKGRRTREPSSIVLLGSRAYSFLGEGGPGRGGFWRGGPRERRETRKSKRKKKNTSFSFLFSFSLFIIIFLFFLLSRDWSSLRRGRDIITYIFGKLCFGPLPPNKNTIKIVTYLK